MNDAELAVALASIHANSAAIGITGGMALLLGFVQWGEAIRLGFRDRTHAVPLLAVLFMLANDMSYTAHAARWFGRVRDPFFIRQWYLIFPFTILELIGCWQIVAYSRDDVFPGLSARAAWLTMAALIAAMCVIHAFIADMSGDYLSQKTNLMTLIGSNLGIYLLVRRRSRKGQSMLLAITLLFCAGAPQFFVLFPSQGAAFQSPAYYAFATLMTAAGILYVVALHRTPRHASVDLVGPRAAAGAAFASPR